MNHNLIENSVSSARWRLPDLDDRAIMRLQQQHDLPELLARLLVARNIAETSIESFLRPKLARDFPDPFALADMEAAANTAADRIEAGDTIGVFADFDVDGATSSALLIKYFRALNIPALVHIPDRLAEGYGPNAPALLGLQAKGAKLVILCDCGVTAGDVLGQVADNNLPVIVLDHHEPEATGLPRATHVIDPKRVDDTSGYTMLAAVGVTFLFCVGVNKVLRERGWFTRMNLSEPPLKDWLDLVALGTLCDMVPLNGPNRLLVRCGLQALTARVNPGIAALAAIAKIPEGEPITPMQVGFGLGPRINAGSRVHQADLGCRLLSSTDPIEAMRLAEILDDCNIKRRELESATVQQAIRKVEAMGMDQHAVIVVGDPEWHPGVAGLVATRLKDKFGRPACVVTYAKNGSGVMEARGSGRSIPGFNIAALFQAARAAGHLLKGGGHAMAGGFSLTPEQLPGFQAFVRDEGAKMAVDLAVGTEHQADGMAFVTSLRLEAARVLEDNLGRCGSPTLILLVRTMSARGLRIGKAARGSRPWRSGRPKHPSVRPC
jgi:single-stranded-DNA-specific exonuclease